MMTPMFGRATKVWFFLIALCFIFLVVGERVGGRAGLFIGLLLAVGLNALVFFLGEPRLLSRLNARRWKGRDPWGAGARLRALCEKHALPEPHLFVMESSAVTAFTVGFSASRPSLCLSTGLLNSLTPADLEAVLAHQLCHADRMDSFGFGVTSVVANTLVGIGQFLDKLWPPNFFLNRRQEPFQSLLSPLGWLVIRIVISPQAYFETDRLAAQMIESRERLGEVLWRLEGLAQTRPLDIPPCTSHLFIVNPEGFRQRNPFLRTHPPLDVRLRNLTGMPTA